MELELNRVDYAIVGLTSSKCLKLLPPSSLRAPQKVAIGDQDGVLTVFSFFKGEIQTVFKTPPGAKITRLDLGGSSDGPKDKIFFSSQSEIKGFTKKGKQFLGFDTILAETVNAMCVSDIHLFICGQHSFHHYIDLKESNNFICREIIKDMIVISSRNKLFPILACNDRVIRIIEDSSLLYSVPVPSCPIILHDYSKNKSGENQIIYGTNDGGVGLLLIGSSELKNSWLLQPDFKKGQVTCLDTYDLTCDGSKELIVGRDDGFIEVYKIGSEEEEEETLQLIFTYTCNETITNLVCGVVRNSDCTEILISTYSGKYEVTRTTVLLSLGVHSSGWIFGLTTEPLAKNLGLSVESNHSQLSQEAKLKINKLRNEIDELEEKISAEKDKYQLATERNSNAMSTVPMIAVKDRFCLHREDASYTLSIEVQTSIDNILIQSDVPVDLLDVEKNSAVISFSETNPEDGNFLLATYRCQVNTTRLDLKIRTTEGQYGTLRTYVTPNIQPKCCQLLTYKIKPLSLHARIHAFDSKRPFNVLTLKGGFSFAEIHAWVEFCLPEVPSKPPPEEPAILCFGSTFLETMLQCTYSKGEAEFKSDNISTISILKVVISKEASRNDKKKRNLCITWEINEGSTKHTLDLLRPKLEHQLALIRQIEILDALSELDLSGEGTFLTDEYTNVLKNEKGIREEYKLQPSYIDRLYGMVTDLFIDKNKFQGINVKNKIPALLEVLSRDNYSYEALLEFFNK